MMFQQTITAITITYQGFERDHHGRGGGGRCGQGGRGGGRG